MHTHLEDLMRLTIFGASGQTGRHLLTQALDAGHDVTAVVRDPTRLPLRHQRLQVLAADVLDSAAIAPAVAGADAVLSALGPHPPRNRSSIMSAATASILEAMRTTGTSRLVVISAAPVATDDHGTTLPERLVARPLLRALLGGLYADMATMEDTIRRSGVDWTILRPPWLSDGPRTGSYRQAKDANLRGGARISRADLADAILASLDDPDTIKATIAIGY
jgi:putative NADH-flavin reductase